MRERALNDKLRKRVTRFSSVIDLAAKKLSKHLLGTKSAKDIKGELFNKVNQGVPK
jgi:hypothetical protein